MPSVSGRDRPSAGRETERQVDTSCNATEHLQQGEKQDIYWFAYLTVYWSSHFTLVNEEAIHSELYAQVTTISIAYTYNTRQ